MASGVGVDGRDPQRPARSSDRESPRGRLRGARAAVHCQSPCGGGTGRDRASVGIECHGGRRMVARGPAHEQARIGWSRMLLSGIAGLDARRDRAKVAELADAPDLGSGSRKAMGVRLPPFALLRSHALRASFGAQALRIADVRRARSREAEAARSPKLTSHENRIRRRQRNPEDPARRNPERRGRRRDRSRRAGLLAQARDPRLPAGQGAGRASSSSASRSRSSTTWRTT